MSGYTCNPELQLLGQSARALIENINNDAVRPYLAQHDLNNIVPDGWYAMQDILNVFNALQEQNSAMADFVAIGMKAAELSPLPPELERMTFAQFMLLYAEKVYPARHRGSDPGIFAVDIVADNALTITLANVYPDDVMYGLVYGFARRFLAREDVDFIVEYDLEQPRCDEGGAQTLIHVTWEN